MPKGVYEHKVLGPSNPNWRGGKTKHPLYEIYVDMRGRCERPTHKRFADYGGRGISVCERWRASFWNFVADMGERPPGRRNGRAIWSMDRVNNDGHYEPGNMRWASYSQQALNRRTGSIVHYRDIVTGRFIPKEMA